MKKIIITLLTLLILSPIQGQCKGSQRFVRTQVLATTIKDTGVDQYLEILEDRKTHKQYIITTCRGGNGESTAIIEIKK